MIMVLPLVSNLLHLASIPHSGAVQKFLSVPFQGVEVLQNHSDMNRPKKAFQKKVFSKHVLSAYLNN